MGTIQFFEAVYPDDKQPRAKSGVKQDLRATMADPMLLMRQVGGACQQ